jgi:hypothetical protein
MEFDNYKELLDYINQKANNLGLIFPIGSSTAFMDQMWSEYFQGKNNKEIKYKGWHYCKRMV